MEKSLPIEAQKRLEALERKVRKLERQLKDAKTIPFPLTKSNIEKAISTISISVLYKGEDALVLFIVENILKDNYKIEHIKRHEYMYLGEGEKWTNDNKAHFLITQVLRPLKDRINEITRTLTRIGSINKDDLSESDYTAIDLRTSMTESLYCDAPHNSPFVRKIMEHLPYDYSPV